jgi:hypothetical protein
MVFHRMKQPICEDFDRKVVPSLFAMNEQERASAPLHICEKRDQAMSLRGIVHEWRDTDHEITSLHCHMTQALCTASECCPGQVPAFFSQARIMEISSFCVRTTSSASLRNSVSFPNCSSTLAMATAPS